MYFFWILMSKLNVLSIFIALTKLTFMNFHFSYRLLCNVHCLWPNEHSFKISVNFYRITCRKMCLTHQYILTYDLGPLISAHIYKTFWRCLKIQTFFPNKLCKQKKMNDFFPRDMYYEIICNSKTDYNK